MPHKELKAKHFPRPQKKRCRTDHQIKVEYQRFSVIQERECSIQGSPAADPQDQPVDVLGLPVQPHPPVGREDNASGSVENLCLGPPGSARLGVEDGLAKVELIGFVPCDPDLPGVDALHVRNV